MYFPPVGGARAKGGGNNILYCLTWQQSKIFAFDLDFNLLYNNKFILDICWGLTTDGTHFIISNGTNNIYWISLNQYIVKIIKTNYNKINALTYFNGFIYANIYQSNIIIKIDTQNGQIIKKSGYDIYY